MFKAKEIRNKIKGIKNTQKITKAMEMIAISKIQKIKKYISNSICYFNNLVKLINNIKSTNIKYSHDYFEERKINTVGYILISTDKGLCGGLNTNLFRLLVQNIKKWENKKIKTFLAIIGNKGSIFFNNFNIENIKIISQITNINDYPKVDDLIGITKIMTNLYKKKQIDRLFIASNKFINKMNQCPIIKNLLPLKNKDPNNFIKWDYLYEPSYEKILDIVLNRYIELKVYHNLMENIMSEQSARMIAMKTATDNGENLIKELNLQYNKFRQSSITQEVNEIISGSLEFN